VFADKIRSYPLRPVTRVVPRLTSLKHAADLAE